MAMQVAQPPAKRLNFARHDRVMRDPPAKAQAARKEVLEKYTPDILHLRGIPWDCCVNFRDNKYTHKHADMKLANTLALSNINPADMRSIQGTTYTYDPASLDGSFRRDQVTRDWNGSIAVSHRELHTRLEKVTSTSKQETRRMSESLKRYQSPVRRHIESVQAQRKQKAAPPSDAELVAKFGPEGAEAMKHIQTLRQPERKPKLKVRAEDLRAVAELDNFAFDQPTEGCSI